MTKTAAQLDTEIAEVLRTETLRRGRATSAVFDHATGALSHFHSTEPGTGRPIERVDRISAARAREQFDAAPQSKMRRRPDGVYFFIISTPIGYERIELEEA